MLDLPMELDADCIKVCMSVFLIDLFAVRFPSVANGDPQFIALLAHFVCVPASSLNKLYNESKGKIDKIMLTDYLFVNADDNEPVFGFPFFSLQVDFAGEVTTPNRFYHFNSTSSTSA